MQTEQVWNLKGPEVYLFFCLFLLVAEDRGPRLAATFL